MTFCARVRYYASMPTHDTTVETEAHAVVLYGDLAARFGVTFSKVHLARLEAKGQFPKRFHLTPGRCAWLQSEVRAWLASRVAQREALPVRETPKPRVIRGTAGRCPKTTEGAVIG